MRDPLDEILAVVARAELPHGDTPVPRCCREIVVVFAELEIRDCVLWAIVDPVRPACAALRAPVLHRYAIEKVTGSLQPKWPVLQLNFCGIRSIFGEPAVSRNEIMENGQLRAK